MASLRPASLAFEQIAAAVGDVYASDCVEIQSTVYMTCVTTPEPECDFYEICAAVSDRFDAVDEDVTIPFSSMPGTTAGYIGGHLVLVMQERRHLRLIGEA